MINTFLLLKNVKSVLIVKKNNITLYKRRLIKYYPVLETNCIYGKNGFTNNKTEGDFKTPTGIFKFLFAFGFSDTIKSKIIYKKLNNNCYYITDSKSELYNRFVVKENVKELSEHLIDFKKEYYLSFVIDFNKSCEKGKGSAIFLHCIGNKPYTAGCIAVKQNDLVKIAEYLDNNSWIIINE